VKVTVFEVPAAVVIETSADGAPVIGGTVTVHVF
jgi:hypothetical protein